MRPQATVWGSEKLYVDFQPLISVSFKGQLYIQNQVLAALCQQPSALHGGFCFVFCNFNFTEV